MIQRVSPKYLQLVQLHDISAVMNKNAFHIGIKNLDHILQISLFKLEDLPTQSNQLKLNYVHLGDILNIPFTFKIVT